VYNANKQFSFTDSTTVSDTRVTRESTLDSQPKIVEATKSSTAIRDIFYLFTIFFSYSPV